MKQESNSLQELWTEQQARLNQMLEFQQFLRDAKMIDDMSGAHEVILKLFIEGVVVHVLDILYSVCYSVCSFCGQCW